MNARTARLRAAATPRGRSPVWVPLAPIGLSMVFLAALVRYHVTVAGRAEASGVFQGLVAGLYEWLGFVPSFVLCLLVMSWSTIWYLTGEIERPWVRLGRVLLLTCCMAVLVNVSQDEHQLHLGKLGHTLGGALRSSLGYILSCFVVAVMTLAAALLATDFFFYRYFEGIGRDAGDDEPLAADGVEDDATDAFKELARDVEGAAALGAASTTAQPALDLSELEEEIPWNPPETDVAEAVEDGLAEDGGLEDPGSETLLAEDGLAEDGLAEDGPAEDGPVVYRSRSRRRAREDAELADELVDEPVLESQAADADVGGLGVDEILDEDEVVAEDEFEEEPEEEFAEGGDEDDEEYEDDEEVELAFDEDEYEEDGDEEYEEDGDDEEFADEEEEVDEEDVELEYDEDADDDAEDYEDDEEIEEDGDADEYEWEEEEDEEVELEADDGDDEDEEADDEESEDADEVEEWEEEVFEADGADEEEFEPEAEPVALEAEADDGALPFERVVEPDDDGVEGEEVAELDGMLPFDAPLDEPLIDRSDPAAEPSATEVEIPRPEEPAQEDIAARAIDEAEEDAREAEQAYPPDEPVTVLPSVPPAAPATPVVDSDLLEEAADLVRSSGRVSASFLQRRMRIDFEEAVDLLEALESQGVVSLEADRTHGRIN